jgi:phosphoribosylanthranilate isomerase
VIEVPTAALGARPRIKICGVTRVEDAELCASLGVERIGLNFWRGSSRRCALEAARGIVERVGERVEIVAVTVDATDDELLAIRDVGIAHVQLHGDEADARLTSSPMLAYKAVRLEDARSVVRAITVPGDEVLIDAFVPGVPGGSGASIDHALASQVVARRRTWLAGGLTSENVRAAIDMLAPYGVDVASGVESAPGLKDEARVRAFVSAVRGSR